jgi:hypothetical protein
VQKVQKSHFLIISVIYFSGMQKQVTCFAIISIYHYIPHHSFPLPVSMLEDREKCNISAGVHDRATILNGISYFSRLQMQNTQCCHNLPQILSYFRFQAGRPGKTWKSANIGQQDSSKCFAVADMKNIG